MIRNLILSIYNDVAGVNISNYLDILEIISYFRSDTFTLIYPYLPTNSYMIACTDTQAFEEGETVHLPSRRSTFLDMI